MKKRKTFAISREDLAILEAKFDNRYDLSDALKEYFEEAFNKNCFVVTYRLPRSKYEGARVLKNVFFEANILDKYNNYVSRQLGSENKKSDR